MDKLERVACYIRVSTQEQKLHGISLDAQREKLKEYADKNNLTITAWYEDEGISGRKLIKNRPALQRMLLDARAGKFNRILFIKLDRFFRSVAEYHECMKLIDPVVWTATEERYDLTTANGRAFVNMKLTIAELEADQTGERIKLVNEYKAKTGQPLTGSVPWSHKIINTDNGKRIIVNPETRDNCIKVIDYYLEKRSLHNTLKYCNQYHTFYDIKGLKKWLDSPLLIGKYRDNANYCEPLISIDKYNELQAVLPRNIRQPRYNTPLFSKLLVCPKCGNHLISTTAKQIGKSNGVVYRYMKYHCDTKNCKYIKYLAETLVEKKLLETIEESVNAISITDINITSNSSAPVIDTESIKNEISRLNYMFEKNRISIEEYDSKYDKLQSKLNESKPVTDNTVDPERVNELKKLLSSGWRSIYDALDREHKRDFWHNILKDVEMDKDGREYKILNLYLYV